MWGAAEAIGVPVALASPVLDVEVVVGQNMLPAPYMAIGWVAAFFGQERLMVGPNNEGAVP